MNEKIKVLHIIRPAQGGMKEHLLNLLQYTDRNKFELTVACPRDKGMQRPLEELGVASFPIPLKGEIHLPGDIFCCYFLARIIATCRYHVVHCHGAKAGLVGRAAAALAQTPVVVNTCHNFIYVPEMHPLKKNFFQRVQKVLGKATNHFITVSEALKEEIIRTEGIPASKVSVIYNGVDTDRFIPMEPGQAREKIGLTWKGPLVGSLARLAPQKGIHHLIKAARLVAEQFPEVRFAIVGDGPLRQELQDMADREQLGDRLKFYGYQEHANLWLAAMDLVVVPSASEGLSIVTLEAMASGRPVIGSRVGGIPELVTDEVTGFLANPGDERQLADRISYLLNRPWLIKEMGEKARKVVERRFSLTEMAARTSCLYLRLLKEQGWSDNNQEGVC